MTSATTCVCEPHNNLHLCCDKTCCSLDRGLNGNLVVELSKQELPPASLAEWKPTLVTRISHIAGFPTAFCDRSINGVVFFLLCGTLLSPVIMLLWTCFAIETTLTLSRGRGGGTSGIVTRRSACCSWQTQVQGVAEVKVSSDDGEGPSPVFMHFSSGAEKLEISTGYGAELEGPVNDWISRGAGALSQGSPLSRPLP